MSMRPVGGQIDLAAVAAKMEIKMECKGDTRWDVPGRRGKKERYGRSDLRGSWYSSSSPYRTLCYIEARELHKYMQYQITRCYHTLPNT
jgi:hypothetical protein